MSMILLFDNAHIGQHKIFQVFHIEMLFSGCYADIDSIEYSMWEHEISGNDVKIK